MDPTAAEVARTQAYWGMVAQIVPVLALALVLEARGMARRYARKTWFPHSRGSRTTFAVLYGAVALGLVGVELVALSFVQRARSNAVAEEIASYVLAIALAYVVLSPVLLISSALMSDTFARLPWSAQARSLRATADVQRDVVAAQRRERSARLDLWIKLTAVQVECMQAAGNADRMTGRDGVQARAVVDGLLERIEETRQEIIGYRVKGDEDAQSLIGRGDAVEVELRDIEWHRRRIAEFAR